MTIPHRKCTAIVNGTTRCAAWTGTLLRRLHSAPVNKSHGESPCAHSRESVVNRGPLPVHSGPTPLFAKSPTTHGRSVSGVASLSNVINVCGASRRASWLIGSWRCEDVAQQATNIDLSITFHRETHLRCSAGWFTLVDAHVRPSASAGFATSSLVPQYGAECADSQGGLQSFRS